MTKEELREKRLRMGLSQRALAGKLGYTEDHIRQMERGWSNVSGRVEKQIDMLTEILTMQKNIAKAMQSP